MSYLIYRKNNIIIRTLVIRRLYKKYKTHFYNHFRNNKLRRISKYSKAIKNIFLIILVVVKKNNRIKMLQKHL